jgi:hypothetical protein
MDIIPKFWWRWKAGAKVGVGGLGLCAESFGILEAVLING